MKIAIIASHPNLSTGYANIASSISNELVKYVEVIYLGFQNSTPVNIERNLNPNVKVFDLFKLDSKSNGGFGDNAILPILYIEKPDIVIVYNDHGVTSAVLKIIKDYKSKKWCYLDLVYECQYPENINYVRDNSDLILTFTDSWKQHLNKVYSIPLDKMYTLYHGIKQSPPSLTKKELGFKDDDYIILSLNRNDARKNIDLVISAFLLYYKKCARKDSLYLFMNCQLNSGLNIIEYIKLMCSTMDLNFEEVQHHIRTPPNSGFVTDNYIHSLYKECDAGISITAGEGFGLTVIEHIQYNKPVICSRIPVFEELLGKDYPFFINPVGSGFSYCNLGGIKQYFKLEDCVQMLEDVCFKVKDYPNTLQVNLNWEEILSKFVNLYLK
jgi:glycosyltransferase involved in cell wall biosynthesis